MHTNHTIRENVKRAKAFRHKSTTALSCMNNAGYGKSIPSRVAKIRKIRVFRIFLLLFKLKSKINVALYVKKYTFAKK